MLLMKKRHGRARPAPSGLAQMLMQLDAADSTARFSFPQVENSIDGNAYRPERRPCVRARD